MPGLAYIGVAFGDVAGPAGGELVRDLDAVRLFKSLDQMQHAGAPAGAKVVYVHPRSKFFQRPQVAFGEVADMDVVAHAGAVGSGIVVPKNAQLLQPAAGHLGNVGHEVVGNARGRLSDEAAFMGPYGVEIAQQGHLPARLGPGDIAENLLADNLCPAIGVGRRPQFHRLYKKGPCFPRRPSPKS